MSEAPSAHNPNTQPVRIDAPTAGDMVILQAAGSPLGGERQLGHFSTPTHEVSAVALPSGDKVTRVKDNRTAAQFHEDAGVAQEYEQPQAFDPSTFSPDKQKQYKLGEKRLFRAADRDAKRYSGHTGKGKGESTRFVEHRRANLEGRTRNAQDVLDAGRPLHVLAASAVRKAFSRTH